MACRDFYQPKTINEEVVEVIQPQEVLEAVQPQEMTANDQSEAVETNAVEENEKLLFGVDSKFPANDLLQNNIDLFEWVIRNKIYPNFWGRNIVGENSLTRNEINFLHDKGCKIAAIYSDASVKETEEQGIILAKKAGIAAVELGIPKGTAIFLELDANEFASKAFMCGFSRELMNEGYTPGFKANTDANFGFDREFSIGMQNDKDVFEKCLVWAVTPILSEYDGMTTSHLIHPDNWKPFAPSGISRNDIAIWQYGRNCHPIDDDDGIKTTFNLNLVRNERVIIKNMF